jgi:zinc finger HIT domain-containing protein 3
VLINYATTPFQSSHHRVYSATMPTLCEICEQEPFKYRCPACSTHSTMLCKIPIPCCKWTDSLTACSLQCSKDHKCGNSLNILIDDAPSRSRLRQEPSTETALLDEPTEQSTSDSIINAPEVQELFIRYPKLRTQLRSIYEASLEDHHIDQHSSHHMGRHATRGHGRGYPREPGHVHKKQWTIDKAINSGLKRLQWDLQTSEPDSNGLAEFCKTIARIQAGPPPENTGGLS